MRQVLHIFAKDTRRFWPEILLNVAIAAALAWCGSYQWLVDPADGGDPRLQTMRMLAGFLTPMMVLAWILLTARVVHAEPLVGDRQFWITRPYAWKKLLAAKMLFLAAYLYLPFVAMQMILLERAGFSPLHAVPALMFNLLLVSGAMIFPLLAIATVTSNFGRVTLVLVGGLLCLWVVTAATQLLRYRATQGHSEHVPSGDFPVYALLLLLCGAVIVMQYAARRTRVAATLLIGTALCVLLIVLAAPNRWLIAPEYARTGGPAAAVGVEVDSAAAATPAKAEVWFNDSRIATVPVVVTGVAAGNAVLFDDVKFTTEAANGARWTSRWQGLDHGSGGVTDSEGHAEVALALPKEVSQQLAGSSAQVHATLALTEARTSTTQITNPTGSFAVAGFGTCKLTGREPGRLVSDTVHLVCRSSLETPLTEIASRWTYSACNANAPADVGEEVMNSNAWEGASGPLERDLTLTPVSSTQNYGFGGRANKSSVAMCLAKMVMTFTQFEPVGRKEVSFTDSSFNLSPWLAGQ